MAERTPLLHAGHMKNSALRLSTSSGSGTEYRSVQSEDTVPADQTACDEVDFPDGGSPDHCHTNQPPRRRGDPAANRTLWLATGLCLLFMVGEVVGGYFANSLAIMTDAAHLLTDVASFLISLFSLYMSSRPPSRRMNFGWHRAEVLGALVSVLLIWIVTGILAFIATQRIIDNKYDLKPITMLITAAIGVGVNIIMGCILHAGGHTHSHGAGSHGHSHGKSDGMHGSDMEEPLISTPDVKDESDHMPDFPDVLPRDIEKGASTVVIPRIVKKQRNINVHAAFIHVIGDLLQSIGVLVAALIIYFKPNFRIVDPICTYLFSVLILITTIAIMRDALHVLMEGIPKGLDFNEVSERLKSLKGVIKVHDLRIWSLTMDKVALSVHLVVDHKVCDPQAVLKRARDLLTTDYNVYESTVQIEDFSYDMNDCSRCNPPST